MQTIEVIVAGVLLSAVLVFTITLRAGLRTIAARQQGVLPEARVIAGNGRSLWTPRRAGPAWQWVPAVVTAIAFTGVFLMGLCVIGIAMVIALH